MNEKHPFTAGLLSFLLPGLGLLYLGQKKSALINFLLVNAVLFFVIVVWANPQLIEYIHYVFLSLAALSAGYARGVAISQLGQNERKSNKDHEAPAVTHT